jgi:hypothetical protein
MAGVLLLRNAIDWVWIAAKDARGKRELIGHVGLELREAVYSANSVTLRITN